MTPEHDSERDDSQEWPQDWSDFGQDDVPSDQQVDYPQQDKEDAGLADPQRDIQPAQALDEDTQQGQQVGESTSSAPRERTFEDMTLAEVLGQFWRAPRGTLEALNALAGDLSISSSPGPLPAVEAREQVAEAPDILRTLAGIAFGVLHAGAVGLGGLLILQSLAADSLSSVLLFLSAAVAIALGSLAALKSAVLDVAGNVTARLRARLPDTARHGVKLALWVVAFLLALWGSIILATGQIRLEQDQLYRGTPYLLAALLTWTYAELYAGWAGFRRWWRLRDLRQQTAEVGSTRDPAWDWSPRVFLAIHPVRVFAALGTGIFSLIAYWQAVDNQFRTLGFLAWLLSILSAVIMFAPVSWSPRRVWDALSEWNARRIVRRRENIGRFRPSPVTVAFVLILILGAVFRLNDLGNMPPQMTSDHKEMILDAARVQDGDHAIFFSNNGGREGAQMYAMALFSQLPGMGLNHETLKLLSVLESLITLPALFWLGRQIAGRDRQAFGNLLGLMLMGLVAVSYWHLAITRLALRIIWTPLVAALLLGFLVRAIRYNRRGDFLAAGLVLGFGLYTYQAVRMLPLVVLTGVFIAAFYSLRDGRRFWRYFVHLSVLVLVSVVIFIPLFRYSVDYPGEFWRRSIGRIFGEERDASGRVIEQDLTLGERFEALQDNMPQLTDNVRDALLMFHWKGDQAWINGVSLRPELEPIAGALLLIGLGAVAFLIVRTRDPVYLLIPVMGFIMLLPSALSLAMVNENPSATRASGALPAVYLLAAFPLTLGVMTIRRIVRRPYNGWISAGVVSVLLLFSMSINWNTYYNEYRDVYRHSTWPYSIPGDILQGFALSDGAYGNAYMIGYPNWWDYRIIGIEAEVVDWPNGVVDRENIPQWLTEGVYCPPQNYALDPELDLLFFYHYEDTATEQALSEWFPDGYAKRIKTYNSPTYDFNIFRVPALGADDFESFAREYGRGAACPPPVFEE